MAQPLALGTSCAVLSLSGEQSLCREVISTELWVVSGVQTCLEQSIRRVQGALQVPAFHQGEKERSGPGLAVDGSVGIELDVREAGVRVELSRPLAVIPQERAVQPVIERRLRFEREVESLKAEPDQPA